MVYRSRRTAPRPTCMSPAEPLWIMTRERSPCCRMMRRYPDRLAPFPWPGCSGRSPKSPVKQAVVMLDLSPEPSSGSDPARVAAPRWVSQDSNGEQERVMLMVGNSTLQEAQTYRRSTWPHLFPSQRPSRRRRSG